MAPNDNPPIPVEPQRRARAILASPYAALILTMFFWAGTTIVVRYLRDDIPPMGLSFWRNTVAFLILLPFSIAPLRREWYLVRDNWKIFALLAFLLWVGGNSLLFLSLQYTIAINAAVINSTEPLFIVLFAWLLFRDPFSWRQGFGLAVSLAGVLVLIAGGSLTRLLSLDFNKGDLIVTVAYVAWGLYATLLRKVPKGMDHRVIALALLGLGSIYLLPIYLVETAISRPVPATMLTLVAVLGIATFASAIPMILWNFAIMRLGPGRAGQYLHLIPAFTVVMAIFFLDEVLSGYHFAGIALIAAGIFVAARR
jgi:drug/metabolite transporter (DMT)-like permease